MCASIQPSIGTPLALGQVVSVVRHIDNIVFAIQFFIQQRYVLARRQGIVHADYVARSGDKEYALGRLVLKEAGLLGFVGLVELWAMAIRPQCQRTLAQEATTKREQLADMR